MVYIRPAKRKELAFHALNGTTPRVTRWSYTVKSNGHQWSFPTKKSAMKMVHALLRKGQRSKKERGDWGLRQGTTEVQLARAPRKVDGSPMEIPTMVQSWKLDFNDKIVTRNYY